MYIGILKAAIKIAEKSSHHKCKVGAVIFKNARIISIGNNNIRSCSLISKKYKTYENSLHAEQAAILNSPRKSLKRANIFVIRLSADKKFLRMAKPCKMCMKFIEYVGIENIFYSNSRGEIIKEKVERG